MKRVLFVIAVLGLSASLGAQSLVDLAKREKARRQGLTRHAVVITNQDLRLVKKIPAVEVTLPEGWGGESGLAVDQASSGENPYAVEQPATEPEGAGKLQPGQGPAGSIPEGTGPLEDQLKAADALVEELTTEMNSLRQQFEAQNTMVPGYVLQERMDETNKRLDQALSRQARIRERMGSRAPAKKDPGESA